MALVCGIFSSFFIYFFHKVGTRHLSLFMQRLETFNYNLVRSGTDLTDLDMT